MIQLQNSEFGELKEKINSSNLSLKDILIQYKNKDLAFHTDNLVDVIEYILMYETKDNELKDLYDSRDRFSYNSSNDKSLIIMENYFGDMIDRIYIEKIRKK